MDIIASIHDKWFQKIQSGEKTIEVRKTEPKKFSTEDTTRIYWYNTAEKHIVGYSKLLGISEIDFDSMLVSDSNCNNLISGYDYVYGWIKETCIDLDDLVNYCWDIEKHLYFWSLGEFEPCDIELPKGRRPPQSWCYYNTLFGESYEKV